MDSQRVVVVVEEADAARTALQWAVRNLLRPSDSLILLHVYPSTNSRTKQRGLRLRGFQLALSFKDLCNGFAEAKVEIIVTEGEKGSAVASFVNKIGATTLIVGLHDQSFLYKKAIPNIGSRILNCRIFGIKHQSSGHYGLADTEFSKVEITKLHMPEIKAWSLIFLRPIGRMLKRARRH